MAGVRPGRRALSCLNPLPPRIVTEEPDMMPVDAPREGWGGGDLDDSIISERAVDELDDSVISERAANELDSSMMSVSDLNSIGFDSASVDWAAGGGTTPRGGSAGGHGGGGGGAKSELDDPMAALLPAQLARAVPLILQFSKSGHEGSITDAQVEAVKSKTGRGIEELRESVRRVLVLALKRDALSRASAQRLFTANIQAMVRKGEGSAAVAELRQHLKHAADLKSLRASFVAAAPHISLPRLTEVEATLHRDGTRSIITLSEHLLDAIASSHASPSCSATSSSSTTQDLVKLLWQTCLLYALHTAQESHSLHAARAVGSNDAVARVDTALGIYSHHSPDPHAGHTLEGAHQGDFAATRSPLPSAGACCMSLLAAVARVRGIAIAAELHLVGQDEEVVGHAVDRALGAEEPPLPPGGLGMGLVECGGGLLAAFGGGGLPGRGDGEVFMAKFYAMALKEAVWAALRTPGPREHMCLCAMLPYRVLSTQESRSKVTTQEGIVFTQEGPDTWNGLGRVRGRHEALLGIEFMMGQLGAELEDAMRKDQLGGPPKGGQVGSYTGVAASVGIKICLACRSMCSSSNEGWIGGYVVQRAVLLLGRLVNWMGLQTNMYPRSRNLPSMCYLHSDSFRLATAISPVRATLEASGGNTPGEVTARRDIIRLEEAGKSVAAGLQDFVLAKIAEAESLILEIKGPTDWTSGGGSDAPGDYMQRLVGELLSPAVQCVCAGSEESQEALLPRIVARILDTLLEHLQQTRARITLKGAERLKGDIDYFRNWIQTSPSVPSCRRAGMLSGPVFVRVENVLFLLMTPRLAADAVSASPLPDAQEWVARRSRKKRALFC